MTSSSSSSGGGGGSSDTDFPSWVLAWRSSQLKRPWSSFYHDTAYQQQDPLGGGGGGGKRSRRSGEDTVEDGEEWCQQLPRLFAFVTQYCQSSDTSSSVASASGGSDEQDIHSSSSRIPVSLQGVQLLESLARWRVESTLLEEWLTLWCQTQREYARLASESMRRLRDDSLLLVQPQPRQQAPQFVSQCQVWQKFLTLQALVLNQQLTLLVRGGVLPLLSPAAAASTTTATTSAAAAAPLAAQQVVHRRLQAEVTSLQAQERQLSLSLRHYQEHEAEMVELGSQAAQLRQRISHLQASVTHFTTTTTPTLSVAAANDQQVRQR